MVHNISIKIVDRFIAMGMINADEKDNCYYGLEIAMQKGISYFWIIFLAVFYRKLFPTILFLTFFLSLRKHSGGFHAATFFRCLTGTLFIYLTVTFILVPLLSKYLSGMLLLILFAVVIIWKLAPVNHPNIDWDAEEIMECRKKTRETLALEMAIIAVAFAFHINSTYIVSAGFGTVMCAVLLLMAKILRQEV